MTPSAADILTTLRRASPAPLRIPDIVRLSGWGRATVIRQLEALRLEGEAEPVDLAPGWGWRIHVAPEIAPAPPKIPKPREMVQCGPILAILAEGPATVARIAELTGSERKTAGNRLGYLREIGRAHYAAGLWHPGTAPARVATPERIRAVLLDGEADRFAIAERTGIAAGTVWQNLARLLKKRVVRVRLSECGQGHQRRQLWRLA